MDDERLQILRMVENGQIGTEEAATLLAALGPGGEEVVEPEPEATLPPAETAPRPWRRFWIYLALAGGVLLVLGALIMGLVYTIGAAPGWRVCGWLPMIGGLGVALLAWWSRGARWLYLRVHGDNKRALTLSFPVPLTLAAWVLRIVRPFVPQLRDTAVDELILALRDSASQGEPVMIDVDDKEDGERVQLYLG